MLGGTGQPVARGPHLAGVFSWTFQEDYLCGRRATLASMFDGGPAIVSKIGLSTIAMMLLTGWNNPGERAVAGVALGVAGVIVAGVIATLVVSFGGLALVFAAIFKSRDRRRREMEQGVLLLGQIRGCAGQWEGPRAGSQRSAVFNVTVAWCLRLPDGRVLEQQSQFSRNDLGRGERPMPPPGAPIAVLVRSPTEFMVL
ncbi:MAG: hypothetical protein U0325_33765 [Polyangiales bacterium]